MKKEEYPVFTVIMRNYTLKQADALVREMQDYSKYFCVEVTLNSTDAYNIISSLKNNYGDKIKIGAGTVRTLEELKQAVASGAEFVLGPHTFTNNMLSFCKENNIISIPGVMTPSEISTMFDQGADIVKVFPAAVVEPRFFKDVQGPLGKISLMAVGGVSKENIKDFYANGATYFGLGSSMFSKETLESLDKNEIKKTYEELIKLLEK